MRLGSGRRAALWLTALLALPACGSSGGGAPDGSMAIGDDAGIPATFGGARPVEVFRVPEGYDPAQPAPLVLILHGYGINGLLESGYLRLREIADDEGFFIVAPDGTVDSAGQRFWNANDVCCEQGPIQVDDVEYLGGLIDEIRGAYAIDPKRIFVVGHSNGALMAHRLACDRADLFAAVVSLAGATWKDQTLCRPTAPVGVLEIHGTADDTVPYEGGTLPPNLLPVPSAPFPGAEETVADWAAKNHCSSTPDAPGAPLDLDSTLAGAETQPMSYPGCAANGAAELWTIEGGSHIPIFTADAPHRIWAFLAAHAKP